MNPPQKDIAEILVDQGSLSLIMGTNLFHTRMPDSPVDLVCVFDNPGAAPLLSYDKATSNYYYSSVSVQVRNTSYASAYSQLFSIFEFLHGASNIVEDETLYMLIKALDDPRLLHFDENDNPVLLVNFEVQRRRNNLVLAGGSGFSSGFSNGFR